MWPQPTQEHPWDVLTLVWLVWTHAAGKERARCSPAVQAGAGRGYMLVSGTVVCCCRSPGEGKVTRWSPISLVMCGISCLAWWLRGCLHGLAAVRSPPLPAVSSGLASHMGVFLGKSLRSLQAGSLTGAGGSASRRQPAKPYCESACPINI